MLQRRSPVVADAVEKGLVIFGERSLPTLAATTGYAGNKRI
jgi:hypothetical protein